MGQSEESCRQATRSPPPKQEMAAHSLVFCLLLLFSSLAKSSSINRLKGDEVRAKRRPEMDTNGFYGDTFSSGFGDFYTAKRNGAGYGQGGRMDELSYLKRQAALIKPHLAKRRPEMDTNGFYGDTFSSGFGDFYTAKRGLPLPRDRQLV